MNVELVKNVLDYIDEHPQELDFRDYHNCFIGMAIRIAKPELEYNDYDIFMGMKVLDLPHEQAASIGYIPLHPYDVTAENVRQFISEVTSHDFTK